LKVPQPLPEPKYIELKGFWLINGADGSYTFLLIKLLYPNSTDKCGG
jgi:hypothetical protein